MNIIEKLKEFKSDMNMTFNDKKYEAKYVLSIVPTEVQDDESNDTIKVIGMQYGQTKKEVYSIDKMYYSHAIQSIIKTSLSQARPIRILCIRPNPVLKPNFYKVYKIQTQKDDSHEWIEIQNISKIYK